MNLSSIPLFCDLSDQELEDVEQCCKKRTYPKNAVVFVGGEEADGLYIIYSGRVKVLVLFPDGREKTLAILGPGETLGEVSLYGSDLRSATVETLEVTVFLILPRQDFQTMLTQIPKLSFHVIELLSRRLRAANQQIEQLTFLNARNRVICTLLSLSEQHGLSCGNGMLMRFTITHAELAKLVGVARETVTKVLNELEDMHALDYVNGKIKLLNVKKLQKEVL